MSTFSEDNLVVTELAVTTYRVNPADTINQGDMLYWNAGTRVATPMTVGTQGDLFVGCAQGQIPIAGGVDNATNLVKRLPVAHKGLARLKATSGESYSHGDAVLMVTDAQTVSLVGGGSAADVIGFVYLPEATAAVVAGSATYLPILLRANFPAAGLLN